MAKFIPVRYSGNSDTPIKDGQVLVDKSTGLMSFDIGESRVQPHNVYGITKHISTNLWVLSEGRYNVNITELATGDIPNGYTVVGVSVLSGRDDIISMTDNGFIKLYSPDRSDINVLIMALPVDEYTNDTNLKSLIALYHMEEVSGSLVDCAGDTTAESSTGWAPVSESKYGCGAIAKSSIGNIQISNIPDLDAFTIEWWQYDVSRKGDGGVVITNGDNTDISTPVVYPNSESYIYNEWKHIALVRNSGGDVRVYINGKLIGFSEFTGVLTSPIKVYGTGAAEGSSKVSYIDELAIFNYARYKEDFEPIVDPYVGANEVLIGVSSGIQVKQDVHTYDIPVTTSDNVELTYDISGMPEDLGATISDNTLTISNTDIDGTYYITVRYPGSISKRIPITRYIEDTTEDENMVLCGYFTSSAGSVTEMTEADVAQSTIQSYVCKEGVIDSNTKVPAGSFIVCLIPDGVNLKALRSNGCHEWSEFTSVGASNGSTINLNGITYRVYGELCLISHVIDINIIPTTSSDGGEDEGSDSDTPSAVSYDEIYVDGVLYTVDNPDAAPEDRVYTEQAQTYVSDYKAIEVDTTDKNISGTYGIVSGEDSMEYKWSN